MNSSFNNALDDAIAAVELLALLAKTKCDPGSANTIRIRAAFLLLEDVQRDV